MMKVYTQGCYDLFHVGHLNLLKRCRQLVGEDGKVIVALLTDEAIMKYKGRAPVIPYADRAAILESCEYVDSVEPCTIVNTFDQVTYFNADLIVIGSDWAGKDLADQYLVEESWLHEKLVYVPYTMSESSTKIKERIKNG